MTRQEYPEHYKVDGTVRTLELRHRKVLISPPILTANAKVNVALTK
jgi:hypothetical protein